MIYEVQENDLLAFPQSLYLKASIHFISAFHINFAHLKKVGVRSYEFI